MKDNFDDMLDKITEKGEQVEKVILKLKKEKENAMNDKIKIEFDETGESWKNTSFYEPAIDLSPPHHKIKITRELVPIEFYKSSRNDFTTLSYHPSQSIVLPKKEEEVE
jgi:hypothetical protein